MGAAFLGFTVGNNWRADVGFNWYFASDRSQAFFGAVRDNGEAYMHIRYQF
jgi:hypothetical protein